MTYYTTNSAHSGLGGSPKEEVCKRAETPLDKSPDLKGVSKIEVPTICLDILNKQLVYYRNEILSPGYTCLNGGVGNVVASAALGFATGGVGFGIAAGVLAGINTVLQKNAQAEQLANQNREDAQNFQSDRGFGSVGQQLARPLQLLPVAHGNRKINPTGGCRVGGYLIHNRIFTECGEQTRNSLYLISVGVLGSIDEKNTLIGEQPQENFFRDEITTIFRPGTENQTVIPEFNVYSQVVAPSGNNTISLDKRACIETATMYDGNNVITEVEINNGTVTVVNPGYGVAGVFGEVPINSTLGGALVFNAPQNLEAGVGLSNADIDLTQLSIEYGFEFFNNTFVVMENGVTQTPPTPYPSNAQFTIVVIKGDVTVPAQVLYYVNGVLVYTSANVPALDIYLDAAFNNAIGINNVSVNGILLSNDNDILYNITLKKDEGDAPGESREFDFNQVTPREFYAICGDGVPQGTNDNPADPILNQCFQFFKVVSKNVTEETLVIKEYKDLHGNGALNVQPDADIYYFNYIRYETTKRVDKLELNFIWNLYSRGVKEGEPYEHGLVFDVYIRRVTDPFMSHLIRCYVVSSLRKPIFNMLSVENLTLGRYYLELRPVYCETCLDAYPIYQIGDFCINKTIASDFENVSVVGEFADTPINTTDEKFIRSIGWDDEIKTDVSSEQGDVGTLKFVNEIVTPPALNKQFTDLNYKNMALVGVYYHKEANENISFFVDEGIECPNYVNYGVTSGLSSAFQLIDFNNIYGFTNDTAREGWYIKNVRSSQTAQIMQRIPNGVLYDSAIEWRECDEYIIYFIQPSCYFPDIFCWFLANELWGLGRFFPYVDEFIDWRSIIDARLYCVNNAYFYDRSISASTNFAEWAETESFNSKLFVIEVGGKFSLGIQQPETPKIVFTAANINNFSISNLDQEVTKFNRLVVVYDDGRDNFDGDGRGRRRPESIIIQDQNTIPIPIEKTLELKSITNEYQAVAVGRLYFKLNKYQSRTVNFTTSYLGLDLIAGDWIALQYRSLEHIDELSGFITDIITPFDPQTQTVVVKLDYCIELSPELLTANLVGVLMNYNSDDSYSIHENLSIEIIEDPNLGFCIRIYNLSFTPNCLSPIIIGDPTESQYSYRVTAVTPDVNSNVNIEAVYVEDSFFDNSNLIVRVDDADILY